MLIRTRYFGLPIDFNHGSLTNGIDRGCAGSVVNEGELSDEVTSFDPADMFTVPDHIEGSAGDVVGLLVVAALFYKLLTVREFSLGPYLVHEGGQTLKSYRRFFCHGCSDRLVWILVGIPGGNIVPLQLVTNRIEIADCPSRRRVI